jgi:hypothetical protein
MQWQTVVVDPDNWVIACAENKEILLWSTRDRPWYNIKTYKIDSVTAPFQLKTNSWLNVEINSNANAPESVKIETLIFDARIKFFTELFYRLRSQEEIQGLGNYNENLLALHEYLSGLGIIPGSSKLDSKITYLNKIKLMQDLDAIKTVLIDQVLQAKNAEQFKAAYHAMERLFFTNILL